MTEVELKVLLPDAAAAEALLAAPALKAVACGPARRKALRSIYFDTPDGRLRAAGLALRLRKDGRRWLQTVKRAGADAAGGLFALEEAEAAAPGGRIDLSRLPDPALREAVEAAQGDAPLAAAFETVIDRRLMDLATPSGRVELAVDLGEIVAGERRAALAEVELELKEGGPKAVYEAARAALSEGGWRFSERSKAARGHALAAGAPALPSAEPRKAAPVALARGETAEAAAVQALREVLEQIDANAAACLAGDDPEGPHQLRVGLRRLRAALGLFRPAIGGPAAQGIADAARALGRRAGALRDLDVQIAEVLRIAARGGPDHEGFEALAEALEARREAARAELRAALTGPEGRGLLLDLSAFTALRGWLDPADHAQTARLSEPSEALAARGLERLWKKVRKAAGDLGSLDVEGRHRLRKALKTLRYGVEFLGPLFPTKKVKAFRKRLKRLQNAFGALNDAAVAEALFAGEGAPCRDDPRAQRAAGRMLGGLDRAAEAEWREARAGWDSLREETPFWR